MSRLQRHWPLVAGLALLLLQVGAVLCVSLHMNQGTFVYALDDPYIHMSMARNIVEHGVWGVTPYGFSSSSSSPLWLVLLSGSYAVAGANAIAPLILNIVAAVVLLVMAYRILRAMEVGQTGTFIGLAALVLFFPLVPVIFCGLEHVVHAAIALFFTYRAARVLAGRQLSCTALLVAAPFLTTIRYEGAMMVGVVALLFVLRRRPVPAAALLLLGALPVVCYGIFSMAHGWLFLPNPILLKGNVPSFGTLAGIRTFISEGAYTRLVHEPHLLLMLVAGAGALLHTLMRQRTLFTVRGVMQTVMLATMALHLQFAGIGWFHRYEAYLVGLFVIATMPTWCELWAALRERAANVRGGRALATTALLAAMLPFLHRGSKVLVTPTATANIYRQQYQMGLFLQQHGKGMAVAANDIGAICWLADIHLVDVYGLGSLETARLRMAGRTSPQQTARIAREHGVALAIVYDTWLARDGGVPPGWNAVGRWTIGNNVVCGSETVTFYAVADGSRTVRDDLTTFSRSLPEGVSVSYVGDVVDIR
ncbi:MAG TPA: hypothetical protein VHI13_18045 [Candidatus Kapabacteria bacterium]|nr:hypothetical protein [Candidatus Kapabacteria bacterium]